MTFRRAVVALLLSLSVPTSFAFSQAAPAQSQNSPRETSRPYSGDLSIFEYPDRDKKLQIDRVMDLLGITAGKNVADIGAGSGWFTVRAARKVGPTGTVLAEDINPQAIEYIGKRVVKENLSNVRTVLGATQQDAALEILKREKLRLISVVPVRTSLEEYFVAQLGTQPSAGTAQAGGQK